MSSPNSKDCETTRPCSYCKREVALANVVLHEVHCMRHIALCPECNEPVPKTQIQEHIAQEHSKLPCEHCEKEFERHELEYHKVNNCGQRPVTCQYCEIELPVSKMQEHEDACGSRTEKCMTCQLYIIIKYAEEHKLSNCKPPEEEQDLKPEQDWEREEESPSVDYTNEYDGYDDMLPCEFCGGTYPLDFLIQHQSGCDKNAMGGRAFSAVRQPHQFGLQDDDVPEDEMRYAVSELEDLTIDSRDEEPEDVKGHNNLAPKDQANGFPINQNRAADRPPNVQRVTSPAEKIKTDKSISSHGNVDAESAQNKTSAMKEIDTSIDVIPCEFCEALIALTNIMDHQKMCRWLQPNHTYKQHHIAGHGWNEYDFDDSPKHYQHRYQRGRYNAPTVRGRFTNGNAKWTSERYSHAPDRNKNTYTENHAHWEAQHNADSTSRTSSSQSQPEGRFGFRNFQQETRQTNDEDQSGRYKGRMDYPSSRWRHEEQDNVRPLTKFDEDNNQRQKGQREEQGTMRQQREDGQWSKRQQEQPDIPSLGKQERNNIHQSKGQQEQASMTLEGQNDAQEQEGDHKYRPQSRGQRGGAVQRLPRGAQGEDKEISQPSRVQPEEQNWRRDRVMDGQGQTKFPRGRGKPTFNRNNAGSERQEQENRTSGEPADVRTERRLGQKPVQNQHNFRDDEGQEMSHREHDDQGYMRYGRREQGRGRHYRGQNYAQEEDYYHTAWPRRSYQDHYGEADERAPKMNRGQKRDYAREDLEYSGRRPTRANQGR